MKIETMQDLYMDELRDLYDAEQQIIKALPEMIEAATSEDLKEALTEHLNVTKTQATRLEKIFEEMGEEPEGEKCKGMKGVLTEGSDLVGKVEDGNVRDAAIIASAQRVEHYEMAGYGAARTFADLLGENTASELLQQTLDEEKEADEKLTELAGEINVSAAGENKYAPGSKSATSGSKSATSSKTQKQKTTKVA
jgi:ferritin-like metal-binding protein YciE